MKRVDIDYVNDNPGIYYSTYKRMSYVSYISYDDSSESYKIKDYWASTTGLRHNPNPETLRVDDMEELTYYKLEDTFDLTQEKYPELFV